MAFGDIEADEEGYGIGFGGPNMAGYGFSTSPRKGPDDPAISAPFNLGSNPFGIAQPGQPVSPISSLVSQVVAPSMVTHNIPTPWNQGAVPTMNDPDEMGPWSSALYGVLSNPGQAVVDALHNTAIGSVLGVPGAVIGGVRTAYDALTDTQDPAPVESIGVGSVSPGMGTVGPDAAQMSLDDFGMSSPPGESVTGLFDPVFDFMNQILDPKTPQDLRDYERTNPFGLDLYDDQGNQVPFQAPDDLSAVFDMSNAIASTGGFESAFGPGFQGISPEVDFGPSFDMGAVSLEGGEALQEALAQRAAETIIAQEAAKQVTPESNKVTIPVSSGPDIVIDVTPSAAPAPSPIRVAAKSIAKPKQFKKLPKVAQKQIRKGKVPTGGSDYVQDMVRNFIAPPTPPTPRGQRPAGANR